MGRAANLAWNKRFLTWKLCVKHADLVADRTGRTYLDAGAAETAVGIFHRIAFDDNAKLSIHLLKFKGAYPAHFLADTYAAAAKDTAVHLVEHKLIAVIRSHIIGTVTHAAAGNTYILGQRLKLAF